MTLFSIIHWKSQRLESCSPKATFISSASATFLVSLNSSQGQGSSNQRYFMSWRRLPISMALAALEALADLDGLGGAVAAVGVGHQGDLAGELFGGEFQDLIGASRVGVAVAAHAAADLELDSFGAGGGDALHVDIHLFLGGGVATGAGEIDDRKRV